ncbi:ABC transporter substrate-binding protein [Streptomyces sp. NBC_00016]|uniref:oligopeptide/dipeptide ABC transporter ATP-binding protein n=1 Tax=Streptomyces sp. NBC_00016 TaxID=2975622 RepID=UPI003255D8D4
MSHIGRSNPNTGSFNTKPVGTGPYVLASWSKGEKLTFKANPKYWGGAPKVKTFTMAVIADDNVRATRLRSGDLDGAILPPNLAATFKGDDGLKSYDAKSYDFRTVTLPPENKVTGDRAIRQALDAAVDREVMVDKILDGAGRPAYGPLAAFPADHLDRHPHQFSGGLAQRAATALALVGDAPLLLADEPTTGLDRDLVDRTVDELRRPVDAAGQGLLMITHDLAAAERIADRVAVMYAGRIVELADAQTFFGSPGPRHPYSRGLLQALPDPAFSPIPGMPPELGDLPDGRAFAARCDRATEACATLPRMAGAVVCHHPHAQEDRRA